MSNPCPGEDCASVGLDAIPLDDFAATDTVDDEMLVYDRWNEDAWIQSDVCYPRNQSRNCISIVRAWSCVLITHASGLLTVTSRNTIHERTG